VIIGNDQSLDHIGFKGKQTGHSSLPQDRSSEIHIHAAPVATSRVERKLLDPLDSEAAAAVLESLTRALRPEGILVIGKAERPPAHVGLSYIRRSIYRLSPSSRKRALSARDSR
jgi:hypothetical protein